MSDDQKQQDEEQPQEDVELTEAQAGEVTGGAEIASNIMKTKHDTVKNSISNVR